MHNFGDNFASLRVLGPKGHFHPPSSHFQNRAKGFFAQRKDFFCLEVCAQAERISPVRGKNTNVLSIPFQDQHSTLLYPSGWAINYDQQQLPI